MAAGDEAAIELERKTEPAEEVAGREAQESEERVEAEREEEEDEEREEGRSSRRGESRDDDSLRVAGKRRTGAAEGDDNDEGGDRGKRQRVENEADAQQAADDKRADRTVATAAEGKQQQRLRSYESGRCRFSRRLVSAHSESHVHYCIPVICHPVSVELMSRTQPAAEAAQRPLEVAQSQLGVEVGVVLYCERKWHAGCTCCYLSCFNRHRFSPPPPRRSAANSATSRNNCRNTYLS